MDKEIKEPMLPPEPAIDWDNLTQKNAKKKKLVLNEMIEENNESNQTS